MTLPSIQISNAAFAYKRQMIFKNLNLHLPAGHWIGLLGPSGVGKSTLLRLLAGLLPIPPTTTVSASNKLPVPEQVAYMAQTDLLLPWLTVFDNALLSVKLHAYPSSIIKQKREQARDLLQSVGLKSALKLYPEALSGGMRQRVALVRTLLMDKPIILMDEPFSALDAITRYKLQALAVKVLQHKSVLFITHDPQEALRLADTIYIMRGQPAKLKAVTTLKSPAPREMDNPEITALQTHLYQELAQAADEASQ